jgi:competence protein ComEA
MRHFSRPQATLVILASFVLFFSYGWRHWSSRSHRHESPSPHSMPLFIQVSGSVQRPGVYSFQQPVSVEEVVARSGGPLPGLDPDPAWRTLQARQGMRILVTADESGHARVKLKEMSVSWLLALGLSVDVNRLSAAELALVPGISRSLAERIVTVRQRRGGYDCLEELCEVDGVGPKTLERLRNYLVVGDKIADK